MTRALLPSGLLALLLLAGGCSPLVQIGGNAPRPAELYTLSATSPAAVPAAVSPVNMKTAVSVGLPTVPGALQTLRIPVTVSDTAVQYMKAAQWSEQPNRLFQRLLADTLVHAGQAIIDSRSVGISGGQQLSGQLMEFGVDVRGGAPQVRVRYDATLSGPAGVRQRRFERSVPVAAVEGPAVADALNRAANAVAGDVAGWLATG